MRKILLLIIIQSIFGCFLKAQINTDTPNLSFESAALSTGWKLYLGDYILNPADSSYTYSWTLKTPVQAGTRIMLLGNGPTVNDPVIACGGLYTNPKTLVARIGDPTKTERRNTLNTAAAEKLEYSFKVTANTTLLSYKLAAVLKVPSGDTHGPLQLPSYKMNITVKDAGGVSYILPCSSYDSKADSLNHSLTRNIVCNSSIGSPSTDYVYQKWISGNIDLSNQIGKTVTITIINHDCLVKSGANIIGGSHDSYGYFWAETKKIELTSFSCENSDATIVAPLGFTSYIWTRSDGKPITIPDVTQPWIASIEKSLNLDGVVYSCAMDNTNSACGAITVSSTITPVKLHPNFTSVAIDAGKIKFTSTSTAEGDSITNYYWDFGDGVGYSNLQNPTYTYSEFKPFNVKLTVTSSKGCSKTISYNVLPTKELTAKIFPPANLVYNGQTKDFTDSVNIAGLQRNIDYYIRYTNRPGTPFYNSYSAPATVGDYTATFELSYLSLLKYFMTTVPSTNFTITKAPITVTISNVAKTYGESITLLREAFTQNMKPLYAGDKIYELELKCNGLSDTASVGTYTIKADSAIGLGVRNYEILFVNGTLTVNQKLLNIAAIDNSKIYGDQVNTTD
ncbi:MAG TPA: PKD domain-containing protein, partial [Paludibacter sp.]